MNKTLFYSILFIVALVLGCAGQIAVKQTIAEPSEVAPGEDIKIHVVLKGSKDKTGNVVVTVREYPEILISLNDNGDNGDEKAGDNIWSFKFPIPWDAPAGIYHLDISVQDKDGNEIITKGFEQQSTGRSGTIEVTIEL